MLKNQIKTAVLLSALAGVLLLVGYLIGGISGLTIGLALAIVINFVSYWWSDKIALAIYRAKKLEKKDAPDLYEIVEEIAKEANIPKPNIYLIPTDNANAFCTGRSPKHCALAVTRGLLRLLNKREIRGVLAHEMAHAVNRDILISSVAATIAAVISYAAFMARFAALFGGMRNRNNSGFLELLVLAILMPIVAMIIRLAISRSREYLADEKGAKLIKDPEALASALEKLEQGVKHISLKPTPQTEATSHMFIVSPFSAKSGLVSLFRTHPLTTERCKRLRKMKI